MHTCTNLFRNANKILTKKGLVYLYGPFKFGGKHISNSNIDFDTYLTSQNSEWGVRDIEKIMMIAEETGFSMRDTIKMPANNHSIIFEKS